jgi:hypothetical protein
MQIGYTQNVITPSLDRSIFLAGFGQNRRAETIHDVLYVRAPTLKDEIITLVLATVDLVGFFPSGGTGDGTTGA